MLFRSSVTPGIGVEVIVLAFAVVVIGGMGSIAGAAIGSFLVGMAHAAAVHLLPQVELFVIYAVMSLVLLEFFVTVLLPQLTLTSILDDRQTTRYAIALAAYSLIYLGAGTLLARLLRRVAQRIYSYQVVAILVLANLLLIVAAEVIHFLSRVPTPQLFDVVNPVMTLRTIADAARGSVDTVACLVVAAVVAIAPNLSALWRGVRDIVNDPVRAQIESQPHPARFVD